MNEFYDNSNKKIYTYTTDLDVVKQLQEIYNLLDKVQIFDARHLTDEEFMSLTNINTAKVKARDVAEYLIDYNGK